MNLSLVLRSSTLAALLATALSAHAEDAFSNLDPSGYVGTGSAPPGYIFVDGNLDVCSALGFRFTSNLTGSLVSFTLPVNDPGEISGPIPFSLTLYVDSPTDTLGTSLGTFTGTSTGVEFTQTTTTLTTVEASGTNLIAGAQYWIVLTPTGNSQVVWNYAKPLGDGNGVILGSNEGTRYGSIYESAFSVQVTPFPEPATLAALGLGAVGLIRCRRR